MRRGKSVEIVTILVDRVASASDQPASEIDRGGEDGSTAAASRLPPHTLKMV